MCAKKPAATVRTISDREDSLRAHRCEGPERRARDILEGRGIRKAALTLTGHA